MSNTIHSGMIGSLIHEGRYFGEDGAVSVSRSLYDQLWSNPKEITVGHINVLMMHMSTMYSATNHCAAMAVKALRSRKFGEVLKYLYLGAKLFLKLNDLVVTVALREPFKEQLGPGQRDVLIAALLVCRFWGWWDFDLHYKKCAYEEIRKQIQSLPQEHVSSVFAKARAVRYCPKYFQPEELESFRFLVAQVVLTERCPHISSGDKSRLAKMLDLNEVARKWAEQSGSPEVILKASN